MWKIGEIIFDNEALVKKIINNEVHRRKLFLTMWNKGENDGYLAGMASSIALIVSIGSLSALYVCPYQATMLSATSSLIGIGVLVTRIVVKKYRG